MALTKIYENPNPAVAVQVAPRPQLQSNFVFIKEHSRLIRVDLRNIGLIEAMSDYVTIYTTDRQYTIHSTMKGMESKLPDSDFIRVHKSYIVRLDRISEIEKDTICVDKKVIPLSSSYKSQLFERLRIV